MARRKRMVYDPPHARKGRAKGRNGAAAAPRPDQLFLSRRMLLAKGGIVTAFAALAGRLGYLQIARGQNYTAQAEGNTISFQNLKATRGAISDRNGRELAKNEQTWQIRVRPGDLPSDVPARRRIFDHLINALNLPDALVLYPRRVPLGEEATVYARAAQLLGKSTLDVQTTDEPATLTDFGQERRVLRVNGEPLEVYLFATREGRRAAAEQIAPNGTLAPGLGLSTTAHLAQQGNALTLLLSKDDALATIVARAVAWLGEATTVDDLAGTLQDTGWRKYIERETFYNPAIVRLEDELTTDQAALCRAYLSELPGVAVVNRLEYLVESGRTRETVVVQTDVSRAVALKLEANKLQLPGIEVDGDVLVRRYPGGEAMSHVLGYVGRVTERDLPEMVEDDVTGPIPEYFPDSYKGLDGIEYTMEELLKGRNGRRIVEIGVDGGIWKEYEKQTEPTVPGKNLRLTIDLEFQQAVSQILREGIRFSNEDRREIARVNPQRPLNTESKAGAVVALDPRNGEVLALVSYPHYDGQLFVDGISERKYAEYNSKEAAKPLLNRAVREIYPPGSTSKLFIAAAALDEKKIEPTTTFTCTGAIMLPLEYNEADGNDHPCWLKTGHQQMNVVDALEQSCDIFFYNAGTPKQPLQSKPGFLHYYDILNYGTPDRRIVAEERVFRGLGIELILKNLGERFWFGEETGIELPAEEPARTLWEQHEAGGWAAGQTINASIGQGFFNVTPLQLALNTAALANGGTIYRPRLLREAFADGMGPAENDERVERSRPEVLRKLGIGSDILDIVKEGMRRVVESQTGTANRNVDQSSKWALTNPAGEAAIVVAGKTGTAELGEADDFGNYARQHAWFTCFAPLDEPEIAIAVIVEDGGEGSSYAVPVADRVLRAWFEINGRRGRGLVLRPEGAAPAPDGSVLSPTAAFPRPGLNAVPGAQPVD